VKQTLISVGPYFHCLDFCCSGM